MQDGLKQLSKEQTRFKNENLEKINRIFFDSEGSHSIDDRHFSGIKARKKYLKKQR